MLNGAMLRENFELGNLTAQGIDLADLYAGTSLPSGFYTWEITAFLADQRQVSNVGMAMMTVYKNNPPQLIFPINNAVVMNTGLQSINFAWLPRHRYSSNAAAGTIYSFKIYEIPTEDEETDPNVIVNSGVLPLFSTQTFSTNYNYKATDPALIAGRRYAIQVQAGDINQADEFENNGLSEVTSFTFGNIGQVPAAKVCKSPSSFLVEKLEEQSLQLTWEDANAQPPIDYLVHYKTENDAVWTERITPNLSLVLVDLSPNKYLIKVSARCSYENKSDFTEPSTITILPAELPEVEETQTTYTNTDEVETPPTTYEPEPEPEPAIDPLNTPIRILLDPTDLPDSLKNTNLSKLGTLPVLSAKPSLEELKSALKSSKIDCASYLANYQCGQNEILSIPSGEIIQVGTGDEIAINSIAFEVVALNGSGNGRGIVKVPMFNNAKFGVEFKGIKVAKGGCVVAGEAVLSNVDLAILNEEQRKKLAETYEVFNKALVAAETYKNIAELLNAIRTKAKAVIDKFSANEKPSTKALNDLAKLSENAIDAKKKELANLKKQAGADTTKYVAQLSTWLAKQDNALECLKTLASNNQDTDPAKKKGGPYFDENTLITECDISALTLAEPVNEAYFIGVQAIQCLTGASLDIAIYYSSIWISMRFDDDIAKDKKPAFGDYNAVTNYKEFSWGEAFTSAGISCLGAMLPPFLAPQTARKIVVGLGVLTNAATGIATETAKQYDIAEKILKEKKKNPDMLEIVHKISWEPVIVNAAVGGMIGGAVSLLSTSQRFSKLVGVIKKKLNLTDLADTKQRQKLKDFLMGVNDNWVTILKTNSLFNSYLTGLLNKSIPRKFAKILTIDEEAVLKFYTTKQGYKEFNSALRGEIPMTEFFNAQKN